MSAHPRVPAWLVTPERATGRPKPALGSLWRPSMCPGRPRMSTHSGISPRSEFETGGVTMATRITDTGDQWLTVRAFAKLNLGLAVTGVRPDGYHELRSLFLRVNLADELSGRVDPTLTSDRLRIDGADELDPGAGHRVGGGPSPSKRRWRDAAAARPGTDASGSPWAPGSAAGRPTRPLRSVLAGRLWGEGISEDRCLRLAADLGADVPFFASGAGGGSCPWDRRAPRAAAARPGRFRRAARLAGRASLDPGRLRRVRPAATVGSRAGAAAIDQLADALRVGIDGDRSGGPGGVATRRKRPLASGRLARAVAFGPAGSARGRPGATVPAQRLRLDPVRSLSFDRGGRRRRRAAAYG